MNLLYKMLSKMYCRRAIVSSVCAIYISFSLWVLNSSEVAVAPISGQPITLYANQLEDNLSSIYSSAINNANKSVLLIVYSLTDNDIIQSLKNARKSGVKVKVICDAEASPNVSARLGAKIDITPRFGIGLMHQKILVIDSSKIWIGSSNMTPESLKLHGNLVAAMESDALANYLTVKASTIHEVGKTQPVLQQKFDIGGQPIELWFLPDNKDAALRLKSLIDTAKKTVHIAMFTWTRQDLAQAVVAAAQRGVKTEVVIDHYSGKGVSAKIAKYLKDNNIDVSLSRGGPLLHHKFMHIDNKILVNGSANWTKAAFSQNDDCFMVIHNLTKEQNKKMKNLWKVIKTEAIPVENTL